MGYIGEAFLVALIKDFIVFPAEIEIVCGILLFLLETEVVVEAELAILALIRKFGEELLLPSIWVVCSRV